MQIGQSVYMSAYKADGTCYPSWCAMVDAIEAEGVVVVTPVAHRLEDVGGA
jgi:hypothetical protein